LHGNTSINPFFYGTYLAETKPNEPVTRTKKQAFQADAVGVAHQLSLKHFQKPHTFRLEWQPGRGGRLDWYLRDRPSSGRNTTRDSDSDNDFVHIFGLKDASLNDMMGSQIPIEPMGIIFNVAVSSTWGFPYDTPDWCPKCFDCDDPKCACSFYPGFCQMIRSKKTAMYIDFVRVYQSPNPDVHVGANHTLGCDPPDYPTKEWIHGHSYRYMRNPPFSYEDKHPLRAVQRGGGPCNIDKDCGGDVKNNNLTAIFERQVQTRSLDTTNRLSHREDDDNQSSTIGRGQCVLHLKQGMLSITTEMGNVCSCFDGYTGPYCMSIDHIDDSPSAYKIRSGVSPFRRMHYFIIPNVLFVIGIVLLTLLWALLLVRIRNQKMERINKIIILPEPQCPVRSTENGPSTYSISTTNSGYSAIR
jgi:Beta-glucan synthesis-associated protein SKN1/KRE6/Sbg1